MNATRTTVIGAVGRIGAGKDSLIDYLAEAHDIPTLSVGDFVRKLARRRGLTTTRTALHDLSQVLVREEGPGVFMREVIQEIDQHDWAAVGISGIRTPADADTLRERFADALVLVHVEVGDRRERFERLRQRGAPRDPQTFSEFEQQERSEEQQFAIGETINRADLVIRNDTSPSEFRRRVEEQLVQPYLPGLGG